MKLNILSLPLKEEFILSEVVRVCPVCQSSDMVVRRKRDGGFMLSCLGYPDCRAVQFFPPCVASAQPHTSLCSNVRYTLIRLWDQVLHAVQTVYT